MVAGRTIYRKGYHTVLVGTPSIEGRALYIREPRPGTERLDAAERHSLMTPFLATSRVVTPSPRVRSASPTSIRPTSPPSLTEKAIALSLVWTPLTRDMPLTAGRLDITLMVRLPNGLLTWMPIEPSPFVVMVSNTAPWRVPP